MTTWRMQQAARPERDVLADDAVRTDVAIVADLGFGMDNGGWDG